MNQVWELCDFLHSFLAILNQTKYDLCQSKHGE